MATCTSRDADMHVMTTDVHAAQFTACMGMSHVHVTRLPRKGLFE